jgi:predicted DNA-binding protein (UPF0251 family)
MIHHMAQEAPKVSLDIHRTRLSPESQARVIHLIFVNELNVDIVAQRMGVGKTTIRRILKAHYEKIDARKLTDDSER